MLAARGWLAGLCLLLQCSPVAAACIPIRFSAGQTATVVEGSAPADDVVCYILTTRAGQRAALQVLRGANTIFGINGVAEAQNAYRFVTERKTYRIEVGQLLRADAPERFTLRVSVK